MLIHIAMPILPLLIPTGMVVPFRVFEVPWTQNVRTGWAGHQEMACGLRDAVLFEIGREMRWDEMVAWHKMGGDGRGWDERGRREGRRWDEVCLA